jgi:hypothetical protein
MKEPKIYSAYEVLKPFKGTQYENSPKKLLIIGESFYVTHADQKHKVNPENWYSTASNQKEFSCTDSFDTNHIIEDFMDPETPHGSHLNIYNHLNHALNTVIYGEDRGHERSTFNKVAFFNFFQRPAVDGDSLKYNDIDIEIATDVLKYNLALLKPDLVILASSLVSRIAFPLVRNFNPAIKQIAIPHPASPWWNREVSWLNGMRTKQFVIKFLNDYDWG